MAWTDAGSRGYEILIEDGKLCADLVHFWPGNAIGIRTRDALPIDRWVHVTMTYDGSSRAGGLSLYVDGRRADCEVVRDKLTKNITGGGGDELTVGQRFRDRGFKNGLVDEIAVFDRALTPLEVAQLCDGKTLAETLARDPAALTAAQRQDLFAYYLANFDAAYRDRLAALKELRKQRSGLVDPVAEIMVMKELPQPRPTFVLRRGAYDAPAEPVSRDTPAALHAVLARLAAQPAGAGPVGDRPEAPADGPGDGQPLVAVDLRPGDRGHARGFRQPGPAPQPSRAARLAGADVHRLGLGRQGPLAADRDLGDLPAEPRTPRPSSWPTTPTTSCSRRGPRFRLPAEMIRDTALAASGLLVGKLGGPPVKPYQPAGLWEEKSNLAVRARRRRGLATAAASTPSGSGRRRRRPCSPSTRPAARSAPSSGSPRPPRSRPSCS